MAYVYYNEFDPGAAAILREAIAEGIVAPGDVDERSISDVTPGDLAGYDQHHFFAGIGGWSIALRLAGWPDSEPVWTGSCPCQPFSQAGQGKGFDDERHLWPDFFYLIALCRPSAIFGEQVASPDGLTWLDLVSTDLEGSGYTVGASDLCSAGVGAPNIRQRLWWCGFGHPGRVADADQGQRRWLAGGERCVGDRATAGRVQSDGEPECGRKNGRLADPNGFRPAKGAGSESAKGRVVSFGRGAISGVGNASVIGRTRIAGHESAQRIAMADPWRQLEWLECRDGKRRPTKPGLFPLAARLAGDVAMLRAAGNAINPWVAKTFIESAEEARHELIGSGLLDFL